MIFLKLGLPRKKCSSVFFDEQIFVKILNIYTYTHRSEIKIGFLQLGITIRASMQKKRKSKFDL